MPDDVVTGAPGTGGSGASGTGVRGRVLDLAGAPVQLATFTVEEGPAGSGAGPVTQQAVVTDAQGRYLVPLAPGHWLLEVSAAGFQAARFAVDVPNGDPVVKDLVLTLQRG